MIRQNVIRAARSVPATRSFSTSLRAMAEGDTGAPKTGGARQTDAFSTREKANEDYYVKQQELKKLEAMQAKLAEHSKRVDELNKSVEEIRKNITSSSQKK